LEAWTGIEPV